MIHPVVISSCSTAGPKAAVYRNDSTVGNNRTHTMVHGHMYRTATQPQPELERP